MDLPNPPDDQELKNIIDKLAQFVARNGPEFEQMTKTKQKGNPKFSFLFSGEHFNYYQYKVTTEQAILKHRLNLEQPSRMSTSIGQQMQSMEQFSNPCRPPFNANSYTYEKFSSQSGFVNLESPQPYGSPQVPNNYQFGIHSRGDEGQMNLPVGSQHSGSVSNTFQGSFSMGDHQQYLGSGNFPIPPNGAQDQCHKPQPTDYAQNMKTGNCFPIQGSSLLPLENNEHNSVQKFQQPPLKVDSIPSNSTLTSTSCPTFMPRDMEGIEAELKNLDTEINELKEQVTQSEKNLIAQKEVLEHQNEVRIKEALYLARGDLLKKKALELNLNPEEFEDVLIPITESCTKDSISNGKHWIFSRATTHPVNEWISHYLLYKCTSASGPFTHKLHIIYLVNDVLHHCLRKGAEGLKESLEQVLSPMYCHAVSCATEDQKMKLDKLLSLWESKMHLDVNLLNELHSPLESWTAFENNLCNEYPEVVTSISQVKTATLESYQKQHNIFLQHSNSQIQQLEQQKLHLINHKEQIQQQALKSQSGSLLCIPSTQQPGNFGSVPLPPQDQYMSSNSPAQSQQALGQNLEFNQPPPGFSQGTAPVVDLSKPPPGFGFEEQEHIVPSVPYFELPAALMGPLIKLTDNKYKPLDPSKIRLPVPTPPTERLLRAVENFYGPPSHEHPRNSEGWEQLALFDFYKAKSAALKEEDQRICQNDGEKSRSPSPITIENDILDTFPVPKGPVRVYRSVSPASDDETAVVSKSNRDGQVPPSENDYSRRSPSKSRSRSLSPNLSYRKRERRRSRTISRSRSRSRSASRSRSPRRHRSRSRSNSCSRSSYSRSKSRSSSRSPRARYTAGSPMLRVPFKKSRSRSLSPPSFGFPASTNPGGIAEHNKGHQMLRSMGWSGTGLGAKEQGISEPIMAGEVRDTPQERFRGLGVPSAQSDPYEAFRKNKGQAFINRMKARAEEKQ